MNNFRLAKITPAIRIKQSIYVTDHNLYQRNQTDEFLFEPYAAIQTGLFKKKKREEVILN